MLAGGAGLRSVGRGGLATAAVTAFFVWTLTLLAGIFFGILVVGV